MITKKILYVIDEDEVSRNMIERLVKNEHGCTILKTFSSCEAGYRYLMLQKNFSLKEYPDVILLSTNLSTHCITRFLSEVEKMSFDLKKEIHVHLLREPNEANPDYVNNSSIESSIEKPISPNAIFRIIGDVQERATSGLKYTSNYELLISKINLLSLL